MVHRIQNFEELATNALRLDALSIAEAGYAALDVGSALERTLRIDNGELHVGGKTLSLAGRRIFFIGVGKCAFAAAIAVEKLFGDVLTAGIALDVSPIEESSLKKIEAYTGTHPLPSESNEKATKHILDLLSSCTEDDLVITLISGGGSTLLYAPEAPMIYTDESLLFSELTAHGAMIQEINTVRKHTSRARGGGLAAAAYPAEVISLIVSDVPGNDIEYIASGPTVLDTSTIVNAKEVLAKYAVAPSLNTAFIETPKEQKYFERVTNILSLSSQNGLDAMQEEAVRRGYTVKIVNNHFTGEAGEVGRGIVEQLHDAAAPTALLYAGESTVTLGDTHGAGLPVQAGGRNQEMVLATLSSLGKNELILPFSSDGHDNTDHAGAIGDETTRTHTTEQNLSTEEYRTEHRSYDFFKTTGDALITGYTGTNVSDFVVALKK